MSRVGATAVTQIFTSVKNWVNSKLPTKVSDLTNDSGFLTQHPSISTSTDTTSSASPSANGTFTCIDSVTRDTNGHVTKVNTKTITLPKDTTYSGMTASEATTGTSTTNRLISPKVLEDKISEKISSLVDSAPSTLDTLNELASALGDDPNFATTIATQIGTKANDNAVVHLSGNETITGAKTFTSDTYAPTPSILDNSTKIATTAFVYNTAAKHLAEYTYIYVAMEATGNGSGSNTSNYMSLTDLRTYLATVHMHSSSTSLNGSYSIQILFKAGDSFGNATFEATKMPGVRNLILNTSTGTNSTVGNYSTNSPTFGNISVTGDIAVTMRNLNCTGRISSQYGAYVSIDTYMGLSSLQAINYGYLSVAKNMVINVCDAHTDYLFSATNNGILSMWPGATITINFRQRCYYTRSLFMSSSNGTAWIGYSSFKLTGTEPMAVWGSSGTLTGTSETAAATVEKAVTLASGQTFTLTTNATAKVKFTVDNTAANPTLNIGGTGAKPIYWNNAPVQATMLMKNITYDVKYNGSQFVIQNAVKRLTNNDFGVFRSSGNYNQTYNSGSWNFTGWSLYYGTGIENSNWRGSHIGNIQQNVITSDNTYPVLISGTANATANTSTAPYFGSGVKINPRKSVVSAKGFSGEPTGTTYVTAVKDGGALVNSQATSWGAIWRASTKDYQVAGATWSNTNNNVYICYSVTNANVEAGTNTMANSLVWAADTGTLTTTTFSGALSGNASTATEFSANKDVTLTGDVTGTASSKAGWTVSTTLANSGVTAGTYGPSEDVTGNNNATITVPEITVDSKGRVTSVTNRTLTCKNNTYNVYNKTLTIQKNGTNVATFTSNSNTNVTANITVPTKTSELTNDSNFLTTSSSLNASKLTGTIDIARLPQGALERVITVANQTARFALTTSSVQLGDTVKQLDTGVMYVVVNESKLNSNDGYLEYTAGSASSVPWSGITSKPTEFTPSSHTHTKNEITDFPTNVSAFTNDSGYLTSHQSLSNYVTLNTAQEITNTKIFKDTTVRKLTSVEAGNVIPTSDKLISDIWQDKNGKELGRIYYVKSKSGTTALVMRAGDWFTSNDGVYTLDASGTNRRAELHLYSDSSGNCCIKPVGYFSAHIKPLDSSVYLGDSTKPFGRVYANSFKFCNPGLLANTDVQTTEEHSVGFFGQGDSPLSYITFQKRPNLKDRVAIRINTKSNSYKSYDFDATCFYPESNNSVDIGSTTNIFKNIYCNNYYKGTTAFGDIVTHNASEFLTSHQSLDSCLKNSTTNNQAVTSTGITRNTAPSSTQVFGIRFTDNNGNNIGYVYGQYATNKSTYVGLYAYNGTTTTNSDNVGIRVGYDASGNAYTYAPTPATADNSTQIATTAFVRSALSSTDGNIGDIVFARAYYSSINNLTMTAAGNALALIRIENENYVQDTNNQSLSGTWKFLGSTIPTVTSGNASTTCAGVWKRIA